MPLPTFLNWLTSALSNRLYYSLHFYGAPDYVPGMFPGAGNKSQQNNASAFMKLTF